MSESGEGAVAGSVPWLADIVLPGAIVTVVAMMLFPLPIALLDILLVANITISLSLLGASLYLSEPREFTTLPALLLCTTLFRLGLNISTTRQLLAEGSAPDIVVAFGNFVVGNNFLVGAAIFLILTVVQFVVIAKGAERVAEVAARFALDALPGKQMSIDADVRAGVISLSEARERRRELQRESRLYGALDGAMKFIKGDAVAALLISGINIMAGLFVGVFQHHLPLSQALRKYTLFTIGDGLVSQIPALLVAVGAGIAVTRVGEGSAVLGRELFSQLGREPLSLQTTALVLFAFAGAPGLPATPFLIFGGALFAIGARKQARDRRAQRLESAHVYRPRPFAVVMLELGAPAPQLAAERASLQEELKEMRARLYERFGVWLPEVQVGARAREGLREVEILLRGVPVCRVHENAADGEESGAVARKSAATLAAYLEGNPHKLMDDTQTRVLFEIHQQTCEDLINAVIPEHVSVSALTALLRQLLRERVPIRAFGTILQTIAESRHKSIQSVRYLRALRDAMQIAPPLTRGDSGDQPHLVELEMLSAVRCALRRFLVQGVVSDSGSLEVVLTEPRLSHALEQSVLADLPLDPSLAESIAVSLQHMRDRDGTSVLITTRFARRLLFELASESLPDIRVLSAEEVPSDLRVEVKGCLRLPEKGPEPERQLQGESWAVHTVTI